MPILHAVQTPDPAPPDPRRARRLPATGPAPRTDDALWGAGERLTLVGGVVLAVSAFTGWYVGSGDGLTLSVLAWHTGTLGKLVFFVGLALVTLVGLRAARIELPAAVPESLVVIALGSLAMIFVLIRIISIPDRFLPADGRGVGIWISLAAALVVIVAGLLQAADEL
jgi:hypothetical protein